MGNDFSVGNLPVEAENNENFSAKFLFKGFEIGLHALGWGISAKIRAGSDRFDLNAKSVGTDVAHVVNVASVVKFGGAFFKANVGKNFGEAVVDNRFFPQIAVERSVDSQVVDIVNAVLQSKLAKSLLPFRNDRSDYFFVESFAQFPQMLRRDFVVRFPCCIGVFKIPLLPFFDALRLALPNQLHDCADFVGAGKLVSLAGVIQDFLLFAKLFGVAFSHFGEC